MGISQSTSSSTDSRKYDVFISFRGEDTRENITSHLYDALDRKKIHTFIDRKLVRGDEISPALLQAIEESRISVIIFSNDYASSKWCLRELAEIMKYKKMNKQIVIPVFYQIDPSNVRKQAGSFEGFFVKHEKESQEEVQIWRKALTEASNLSGWDSSVTRPESKLVSKIVSDIWKKLNNISSSSDFQGLIGIHERIDQVVSLLCLGTPDFRIIGIWGMGGIGKTTIVGAVYELIRHQFEGHCFVGNVRERSERRDVLVQLREEVMFRVLNEENIKVGSEPSIRQSIKNMLNHKKVFIILDDVNNFRSLQFLAGGLDRFAPGSRIIVTSRDKQVLHNCGLNSHNIYEVGELNNSESIQLFYNFAFREIHPPKEFIVPSNMVVKYAKGNPLALVVLGSSLYQKSVQEWKSAIAKFQRILDHEILDVLKISYDGLDDEEKSLFLDIACFFKGKDKDYIAKILVDHDHDHYFSLDSLVCKSLITVSVLDNKIQMHDLLQQMGREIVRKKSPNKPGNRSRLWEQNEVLRALKTDNGTYAVRGIFLDMAQIDNTYLSSQAFEKMDNLRFLNFYDSHYFGDLVYKSKVHFRNDLSYFSDELRSLNWLGYPLEALPSNFTPDNLIELRLTRSNLERLWEDTKHAPKLKCLILHDCPRLTKVPDLLFSPLIEEINLENCKSLLDIRASVQHLNNLCYLKLRGCENLRSIPSNIHFESLTSLDLSYCINLTKFPQISGNIKNLYLCETAIEEVPSSIQSLSKLVELNLSKCSRLEYISTSICKLKYLAELNLLDCSKLESFPEISSTMECLRRLDLSGTAIKYLSPSIRNLSGLKVLLLKDCKNLKTFPNSISKLEHLDLSDCSKLESYTDRSSHSPLSGLCYLERLFLNYCNLMKIPEYIGCLSSLIELELCGNSFQNLPKSFKELRMRKLRLNNCNMLQSLTELPSKIEYLEAMNCNQLWQLLPDASEFDKCMKKATATELYFIFTNSLKLNPKAISSIFAEGATFKEYEERSSDVSICLPGSSNVSICLPGSEIPEWFNNQNSGSSVNIQMLRHKLDNGRKILGFVICAVVEFKEYYADGCGLNVGYEFHAETSFDFHGSLTVCPIKYPTHRHSLLIDSDHIVVGYHSILGYNKLLAGDSDYVSISFEFNPEDSARNPVQGCKVKCCGVCPIYGGEPINSVEG